MRQDPYALDGSSSSTGINRAYCPIPTGFEGRVMDLEVFEPAQLQATSLAVFLLATYGEGDPTDNAMAFAKWLKNEDGELSGEALGGLKYAVFGLGSTQYEHYNKMGKVAHKRLKELGAEAVHDLGLGDELTVEEDFEKWTEGLWPALSAAALKAVSGRTEEDRDEERRKKGFCS